MPDEKEVQDIKAAVDGGIGDAPAPSEPSAPETVNEESSLPSTSYASSNYSQTNDYSQSAPSSGSQLDMDKVHEIIEAIVNEKWQDAMGNIGDLALWKQKINTDVVSIKQELIRVQERFEQMQNAILGRVKDYDEGIRGINTEMKALEKVFEKILEPLTSNIKELGRITQDLKKGKH